MLWDLIYLRPLQSKTSGLYASSRNDVVCLMGNVLDGRLLGGYLCSADTSQAHITMNHPHVQCFCFVCVSEGKRGINNGLRPNKLSVDRLWAVDHWDQH